MLRWSLPLPLWHLLFLLTWPILCSSFPLGNTPSKYRWTLMNPELTREKQKFVNFSVLSCNQMQLTKFKLYFFINDWNTGYQPIKELSYSLTGTDGGTSVNLLWWETRLPGVNPSAWLQIISCFEAENWTPGHSNEELVLIT